MKMDRISDFYNSLASEEDLQRMVDERQEESLHLEFKQKQDRRHGRIDNDDSKNFSKSLSNFANAAGGVLIFGIETKGKPDHAHELKPIVEADAFRARLNNSVLDATQPIINEVELKLIKSIKEPGSGYVLCIIPPSDKSPHRAIIHRGKAGEIQSFQQYYRRTMDKCRVLDHIELEDMFGRRQRPLLSIAIEPRPRPDGAREELHFYLINEGSAIARYIYLHGELFFPIGDLGPTEALSSHGGIKTVMEINNGLCFQSILNEIIIHPIGIKYSIGYLVLNRPTKSEAIRLKLEWCCDQMRRRFAEVDIKTNAPLVIPGTPM